MNVRLATEYDLPAIAEIYNHAIAMGNATADRNLIDIENRRKWFANHRPDDFPVWVTVVENKIAGYGYLTCYREGRIAFRKVAEVSYYVHQNFRRKGVATNLLKHAIDQSIRLDFQNLVAILLGSNVASIALLEKFGFEEWGKLPKIAELEDQVCDHLFYGLKLSKRSDLDV